ncbi:MAG: diguanylate cyclase [Woeseiaceae bacterium]
MLRHLLAGLMMFGLIAIGHASDQVLREDLARMTQLLEENQTTEALALGLSLKDRASRSEDALLRQDIHARLARFYIDNGNAALGLRTVYEALPEDPLFNPTTETGQLVLAKTMALIKVGSFEQANEWARRTIIVAKRLNDEALLGHGTYMLASTLARTNQPDAAELAYEEARQMLKSAGRIDWSMRATNDLAMIHKFRARYDIALPMFEALLVDARARSDGQMIVYALLELGDINRLNGRYGDAERYLRQAEDLASEAKNAEWSSFVHAYLIELYRDRGDDDKALRHTNELAIHKAALQTDNAVGQVAKLEIKRMATAHEHQMEILEKERELAALTAKRSRAVMFAVMFGTALVLIAAVWMYRRWREQADANARLRASNIELDQAARTDALTGLANRHALNARLRHLKRNKSAYSLILLDLDHFKAINDNYGHDHGDGVLIEIAQRIKARLRQTDLAVRWGGEEFLIVLSETARPETHDIAQQLFEQIRKRPVVVQGEAHFITATFGVAASDGHDNFESTLKSADEALTMGKRAGRDKIASHDHSPTGTSRAINLVA